MKRVKGSPLSLAYFHALVGEPDRMFEYLHAAFEERDPWLTHIGASRIMARYRGEDRFPELLRRMNL